MISYSMNETNRNEHRSYKFLEYYELQRCLATNCNLLLLSDFRCFLQTHFSIQLKATFVPTFCYFIEIFNKSTYELLDRSNTMPTLYHFYVRIHVEPKVSTTSIEIFLHFSANCYQREKPSRNFSGKTFVHLMTDRLDSGQFFIEERLSIYNSQFGEAVHGIPMDRGREKRGLNRRVRLEAAGCSDSR